MRLRSLIISRWRSRRVGGPISVPQVVEDSGVRRFISRPIDSLLRQARFVPLLAEVLPVLVLVDEWI